MNEVLGKVGGCTVLNEANHYNFNDCHPQYVSKSFNKTIPAMTDANKPYYAIAYPRVYNDNTCIYWRANIYNVDNGELSSATIDVKIYVGLLSDASTITAKINISNAINFDGNSVNVTIADVDNGKVFYIYLKQSDTNKRYCYQVDIEASTRNNKYSYDIGYGASYRTDVAGILLD